MSLFCCLRMDHQRAMIPGEGSPARYAIESHSHNTYQNDGREKDVKLVYVCLCNALTDRRLKEAATATGSQRPGDIYSACGCRAQCGQCVKAVLDLIREHAGQIEAPAAV
jgi:bacterioferritin-associated ferredoxin